jgi:hypothetical protein
MSDKCFLKCWHILVTSSRVAFSHRLIESEKIGFRYVTETDISGVIWEFKVPVTR